MYGHEDRINYQSEFPKKKAMGNKWVSVQKSLPKDDNLVLVYCKSGATFKGHYTNNQWHPDFPTELLESYDNWNNLHFGEMSDCVIPDATHWMRITPPIQEAR